MSRLAVGLVVALATGCGVNSSTTFSVATPATPEERGPIDYAGWPTLTKEPVTVTQDFFADCVARPGQRGSSVTTDHGPHSSPTVRYYVNPDAEAAVKAGTIPVPVETIIVKEKWWLGKKSEAPEAYAAMIKREPGYDPANGDWEYLYVHIEGTETRVVERGKLVGCITCHRIAKDRDYLYRTYLKK